MVPCSPVAGKGFDIAGKIDDSVKDVLLFAAGTGIAPLRSVIESGVLQGKSCTLYYGARSEPEMAYRNLFESWNKQGVKVVPVFSKSGSEPKYVQDALAEAGVEAPGSTAALMCGMKGMTEAVKSTLMGAGVAEDRILMNF